VLTVVLIVNTSLMAYMNYQTTFTASMAPTGSGESLEIGLKAEAGRPSPLAYYLRQARGWISAYFVGGTERTNAETGIIVAIDGANIGSTASVDYYIEAKESTGQGQAYRFLEGNGTSVTVNGADLDLSNQTSIEHHLTAMGLSTTASHTIDYYVYVKASATGAISGETLTSEITYTLFDTVSYEYGTEVVETLDDPTEDIQRRCLSPGWYESSTGNYLNVGNSDDPCHRVWIEWPTTVIPDSAPIEKVEFKYWVINLNDDTEFVQITNQPTVTDHNSLYWYLGQGNSTAYVQADFTEYPTDDVWVTTDLGSQAAADLEDQLSSNWFAVGWRLQSEPGSLTSIASEDWGDNKPPTLLVTYMSYSSSWYPIGPVSVLSMPLGQTLGAITVIALSCYAVYTAIIKGEKKK